MYRINNLGRLQKAMEMFSPNIRFREVELGTAADIVQHSFIVQESISPLNLELCQSYILLDEHTNSNLPSFSYSKDLINTEEKCRKVFSSSRSLLYTLHLDFPKDKERSLKSDWMSINGSHRCRETESHIAKIYIEDSFYTNVLSSHVDYACSRTNQNWKVLKWFIKSDVLVKPDITWLPDNITNRVLDFLHPALYDSEFVKNSFRKLGPHLVKFLSTKEYFKHGKRINFIYQFHRTGWNSETFIWLEVCDIPTAGDLYKYLAEEIYNCRKTRRQRRHNLLLQMLSFYIEKSIDPLLAAEFLRVVWNSVSDSFISSNEIAAAIEKRFGSATVADVCNFYSEAVGGLFSNIEPRPLKHYCRTTIRKKMYGNPLWIPDGIKKLSLPKTLQSYLNLDE